MDEFAIVVNIRQIRLVRNGNPFFPFFFSRCFVGFNTFVHAILSLSLDVIMQIAKREKSLEITSVISNVLLSKGPCVQGFVLIVSNTS